MAQKRVYAVMAGLLISLVLFVGCGPSEEPDATADTDIEARVAAAVDATVVVAVEQTVAAQVAGNDAAAEQGAQASVAEQPAEEIAAAPADNSRAIVDYLLANGRHFIGNPNADVVIIEFSDFQ